jgi:hypothetical protein
MTTFIETRQSEFTISEAGDECRVKITVITKKYEESSTPTGQHDTIYYDISYEYIYNGSDARRLRPFLDDMQSEGDIIKGNCMTSEMIKYLLSSDEELSGLTGNTQIRDYRVLIMKALALFWD